MERCEPSDPNRCQANSGGSQCPYKTVSNQKYCTRHMVSSEATSAIKAAKQYRLNQYQERVSEFATNNEIKNLRAEIGILRMTLESTLNQCTDQNKLLLYSGKISDMVLKISNLVKICHRLDTQMGMTLDRDKVMLIGTKVVEIIAEYIPDPSVLDTIGERLVQEIVKISIE